MTFDFEWYDNLGCIVYRQRYRLHPQEAAFRVEHFL